MTKKLYDKLNVGSPYLVRYANRKIYNARSGRCVSHGEILELYENDRKLVVIDHKTGNNVTKQIILSAAFRNERYKNVFFNSI